MTWTAVEDYRHPGGWGSAANPSERARGYCLALERGEILLFREPPFPLTADDRELLLTQRQPGSALHKNISYRAGEDEVRGLPCETGNELECMLEVMRRYSKAASEFVSSFLLPYAAQLSVDYASFRPLEEHGRDLPLHKRNDLLHVDSFPSRPTGGKRILRVFTNLNPTAARVWNTGPPFAELGPEYAPKAGLPRFAAACASATRPLKKTVARALGEVGFPIRDRCAYDEFMLHFHNWLKENRSFQEQGRRIRHEFPPGATWLVFTDGVPHAVLSGQYALEHSFLIPREALVDPASAPIAVLEKLSGTLLAA